MRGTAQHNPARKRRPIRNALRRAGRDVWRGLQIMGYTGAGYGYAQYLSDQEAIRRAAPHDVVTLTPAEHSAWQDIATDAS